MSEAAKRQRDGDLLEWEHDVESIVSYLGRVQNLPFPLPSTVEIPMWVVRWKISPSCMWTQKFPCRKTCPLWIGDAPSAPWIRWRTRTFATWRWLLWLLRMMTWMVIWNGLPRPTELRDQEAEGEDYEGRWPCHVPGSYLLEDSGDWWWNCLHSPNKVKLQRRKDGSPLPHGGRVDFAICLTEVLWAKNREV